MMNKIRNLCNYPEPERVYLGKSPIVAFVIFPNVQESEVPEQSGEEVDVFYNPEVTTLYDVEFRMITNPRASIEPDYLVQGVEIGKAREMCHDYLVDWCSKNGLALI